MDDRLSLQFLMSLTGEQYLARIGTISRERALAGLAEPHAEELRVEFAADVKAALAAVQEDTPGLQEILAQSRRAEDESAVLHMAAVAEEASVRSRPGVKEHEIMAAVGQTRDASQVKNRAKVHVKIAGDALEECRGRGIRLNLLAQAVNGKAA